MTYPRGGIKTITVNSYCFNMYELNVLTDQLRVKRYKHQQSILYICMLNLYHIFCKKGYRLTKLI
jgi:hypothetical protein